MNDSLPQKQPQDVAIARLLDRINAIAPVIALVWLIAIFFTLDPAYDDFMRYWQAAVDVLHGHNPYTTRQDYFYPPFFAYLVLPFGLLPHRYGQWLWFLLNSITCVAFIRITLRASGWQRAQHYHSVVLLLMLFAPPTRITLQLGQVSAMLAWVLVMCFVLAPHRPRIVGMLLALATLIRINPAFIALAYLLSPLRRVAWYTIASGVVMVGISLLLFGIAHIESYLQTIVQQNIVQAGVYPYTGEHNISFYGFWHRLLTTNTHAIAIAHMPQVASLLTLLCSVVVIVLCIRVGHSNSTDLTAQLRYSVWLCGMMLLLPTNGYYNLVALLFPLLVITHYSTITNSRVIRTILVVATLLVCIPPSWSNAMPMLYQWVHVGWGIVALTPAFYGLCIYFGLATYCAIQSLQSRQSLQTETQDVCH